MVNEEGSSSFKVFAISLRDVAFIDGIRIRTLCIALGKFL